MPEETNNAAVSGEWKLVLMAQLKKWHRDMDACQKVMWLRGGFDPAYCMDAQDCLKEMDSVLAISVPPAGGEVEVLAWMYRREGGEILGRLVALEAEDLKHIREGKRCEGRTILTPRSDYFDWIPLVDLADFTRLQVENEGHIRECQRRRDACADLIVERDALKAELATARKQAYDAGFDTGFANGKEQGTRVAKSELTKARERAAFLEFVVLEVRGCLERPDVRQHGWEDRCLDQMYAAVPALQSAPAAKGSCDE
jgi:hypothetical protein